MSSIFINFVELCMVSRSITIPMVVAEVLFQWGVIEARSRSGEVLIVEGPVSDVVVIVVRHCEGR